jgi:hypothetical protein
MFYGKAIIEKYQKIAFVTTTKIIEVYGNPNHNDKQKVENLKKLHF